MAEGFFGKLSEAVEKESQQVQETATESVGNVAESAQDVASETTAVAEQKVEETKKSFSSFISNGLSKAEGLVHSAKDFADQKGTDLHAKIAKVSDSFDTLVKMVPGADPLPVSDKDGVDSSSSSAPVANDRDLQENEALISDTTKTPASWTNCFGLCECLTSSDR